MITKFLIKFGDNDFHITFKAVVGMLGPRILKDTTKDRLVEMINEAVFPAYLCFQNRFTYKCTPEDFSHIKEYLKVPIGKVLINEEVDEVLEGDYNHSYFYYLDGKFGSI